MENKKDFSRWLSRERKEIDKSKLIYKRGDELFTIREKQVIPFVVDKAMFNKQGSVITAVYICSYNEHTPPVTINVKKHDVELRQNHNLFATEKEAQFYIDKYLEHIKQGDK